MINKAVTTAPVTRDELHLAWAKVPNTAGIGGGFDAALQDETLRRCLVNLVFKMRERYGRTLSKPDRRAD